MTFVAPMVVTAALVAACGEAATTSEATATPEPTATAVVELTAAPVAEPTATEAASAPAGDAAAGRLVAEGNGCQACHSTDGSSGVGPSWQGLFGTEEQLADGSSVTVDADYIRTSINDPDAQITEGFDSGLMPKTYADTLSDEDIEAIIAYIQSL